LKKRILIHIGTGKTGTGSIQNFLFQNRDDLLKNHALLYPLTGLKKLEHFGEEINAHYSVVSWIVDRNLKSLEKLIHEIDQSSANFVVISCENFYHRLTRKDIEFLADCLTNFDTRVVCYVRRQDRYMESAWKQQVKVGDLKTPFRDFLKRHISSEYLHEVHANYQRMLSVWGDVFGIQNIILSVFDRTQWRNKDLVDDFLDLSDFPASSDVRLLPRPAITNIALPSELARLICRINGLKKVPKEQQQSFVMYLRGLREYNNPPLLSLEDRVAILENYKDSNEVMFRQFTGKPTPRCFTEAALPKAGKEEKLGGASLEDIAMKSLISSWENAESAQLSPPLAEQSSKPDNLNNSSFQRLRLFPGEIFNKMRIGAAVSNKSWPPQFEIPLDFEPNLKPKDVVGLIKQHQNEGKSLSIIRLGDGEAAVIGYPEFTPVEEYERFLRVFFGNISFNDKQKHQFVRLVREAVRAADVIGVTGGSDITKFTVVRHFMRHYQIAGPHIGVTQLSLHRSLQEAGLYADLLINQETVGLITCRDVEGVLKTAFNIEKIVVHKVPEEVAHAKDKSMISRHFPDRFEEIRDSLVVSRPGMLFLIGAGPLGKVYCQWVKERGGIGLDVGSMFDAWAGLTTRRYMKNETGDLDAKYRLNH